jgi:hypothetical protein
VSSDPAGHPTEQHAGPESAPGEPSEEELRAAYEAELSRITSADMMLQAAVSLLNIGARRLGLMAEPPGGGPEGTGGDADAPRDPSLAQRDLDQVRDAVDGVKALLAILERSMAQELGPLWDALSRLQMAYAREVQARPAADQAAGAAGQAPTRGAPRPSASDAQSERTEEKGGAPGEESPDQPGPAESSGRLWVPGR